VLRGIAFHGGQTAIKTNDIVDALKIKDVIIEGPARGVLSKSAGGLTMQNVQIRGTLSHGIVIQDGSSAPNLLVDVVVLKSILGVGLYIGAADGCVDLQTPFLASNAGPGLYVKGGCVHVVNGWLLGNHRAGVELAASSTGTIEGTWIADTQTDPITGSEGTGVQVELSQAVLSNPEIEGNAFGLVNASGNVFINAAEFNCNDISIGATDILGPPWVMDGDENKMFCGCGDVLDEPNAPPSGCFVETGAPTPPGPIDP
jgi:hypothetical protein